MEMSTCSLLGQPSQWWTVTTEQYAIISFSKAQHLVLFLFFLFQMFEEVSIHNIKRSLKGVGKKNYSLLLVTYWFCLPSEFYSLSFSLGP